MFCQNNSYCYIPTKRCSQYFNIILAYSMRKFDDGRPFFWENNETALCNVCAHSLYIYQSCFIYKYQARGGHSKHEHLCSRTISNHVQQHVQSKQKYLKSPPHANHGFVNWFDIFQYLYIMYVTFRSHLFWKFSKQLRTLRNFMLTILQKVLIDVNRVYCW